MGGVIQVAWEISTSVLSLLLPDQVPHPIPRPIAPGSL